MVKREVSEPRTQTKGQAAFKAAGGGDSKSLVQIELREKVSKQ